VFVLVKIFYSPKSGGKYAAAYIQDKQQKEKLNLTKFNLNSSTACNLIGDR